VCIVEFRVMAKYVKILSVVQQCFYGQMYVAVNNAAYVSLHVNTVISHGVRGGTVVKVLCYKSEGRCFDPR
jgi:hypothetical protein